MAPTSPSPSLSSIPPLEAIHLLPACHYHFDWDWDSFLTCNRTPKTPKEYATPLQSWPFLEEGFHHVASFNDPLPLGLPAGGQLSHTAQCDLPTLQCMLRQTQVLRGVSPNSFYRWKP